MIMVLIIGILLVAAPIILGFKPVMVLSGSMEPQFHVGSVIYYKQTPFEDIEVGDSITFQARNEGDLITHRVIEKDDLLMEFATQGDANSTPDPNPVSYDRVVGKALEFCIPYAGYVIAYCRQIPIIIALGSILVLNMVLDGLLPEKKKGTDS